MNYQYRYGATTTEAIKTLYADGGCSRYYQGLSAALIQGPLARFGDTAANAGILALLESNPFMKKLPSAIKTIFASLCAAGFRIILTPIDTVKTTLQTEGKPGLKLLRNRVCRYSQNSDLSVHLALTLVPFRSRSMGSLLCGLGRWQQLLPPSLDITPFVDPL